MQNRVWIGSAFGVALLACTFLTSGGCPLIPLPTGPFSQIVVFGDSLSDLGNDHSSLLLFPASPYSNGRFSNGDLWIQYLATHYNLPIGRSHLASGKNFAYGGARTGAGKATIDGLGVIPNMRDQLSFYTDKPSGTELFVVWGGGNDIIDTLKGTQPTTAARMAADIAIIVQTLYDRGGRYFLVPNLPDAGRLPRFLNTDNQAAATQMSDDFDTELNAQLDQLDTLPGITIVRANIEDFVNASIANPPPPITNTTDPAWTGDFLGHNGTLVSDPDVFMFFDHIHPSRVAHQLIGEFMIQAIDAVFNTTGN
jgi:phospholipase/lecithinase/hemolysin